MKVWSGKAITLLSPGLLNRKFNLMNYRPISCWQQVISAAEAIRLVKFRPVKISPSSIATPTQPFVADNVVYHVTRFLPRRNQMYIV